jgi:hypothetical protein
MPATGATASGSIACPASSITMSPKWPRGTPRLCNPAAIHSVATSTVAFMTRSSCPSSELNIVCLRTVGDTSLKLREALMYRSSSTLERIFSASLLQMWSEAALVGAHTRMRSGLAGGACTRLAH